MMLYLVYIFAGIGAGVVTGLAGLSAAVIITPLLVSICGWKSYDAVTVALAADVLASLLTAYTYYKNKNIDLKHGMLVAMTAFVGTIVGSYSGFLFSQSQPDGLGYISMLTTIFLGIKFLVKPIEE
ncbi:TSUP family transporter, partial [Turicibacter sanguinis]|nr:TSUP family transporter [Turicibacter sanguinis]